MTLSHSGIFIIAGILLLFGAFIAIGAMASGILEILDEKDPSEKLDTGDYPILGYLASLFILFIIGGIISLIMGAIYYRKERKKGTPLFSPRIKKSVNLTRQTIYAVIPILDLYAAYKIEKLTLYFVIILSIGIGVGSIFELLLPYPYHYIMSVVVLIPIAVFLIRKWSKKWNIQFDSQGYE